jgi:hypothetical protein
VTGLDERLGASLRRAPYVWAVLTTLLYLMLVQPASEIVTRPVDASTPIAIAAAALIAYAVVASLVLVPRFIVPRLETKRSENHIALLRWVFTATPVIVGFSAVGFGGQPWAFVLGLVVSVALTIYTARTINRVD